jgi:hypothetical protein
MLLEEEIIPWVIVPLDEVNEPEGLFNPDHGSLLVIDGMTRDVRQHVLLV